MSNFNRVVFFNKHHNGDQHVSRSFIRFIALKFPQYNYVYCHNNSPVILQDLPIKYNRNLISTIPKNDTFLKDGTLYISTWYGAENRHYLNKYMMTFNCLYQMFKDIVLKYFHYNIDNEPIETFIPFIDYSKFDISPIDDALAKLTKFKKVMICSGVPKSGQSYRLDLVKMAIELSRQYRNIVFFITNDDERKSKQFKNIIYTPDIIKQKCDLNENAYLASKCNAIIGQLSGVHTFCYNLDIIKRNILLMSCYFEKYHIPNTLYFNEDIINKYELRKKLIGCSSKQYEVCRDFMIQRIGAL